MSDWKLVITRVDNGYTLRGIFGENEEETTVVIEDGDDWNAVQVVNWNSAESLLWEVMEYFGLGGSKHDKYRIRIEREKQEWVDDKENS